MLFDVHMTLLLQNGWKVYGESLEAFKAQFPGTVAQDYAEALHGVLTAEAKGGQPGVRFFPQTIVHGEALPCGVVALGREDALHEPLGRSVGRDDDGRLMFEQIVRQHASVHLYAYNPDALRAMTIVTRAIVLANARALDRLGYASLEFEGMAEILPHEELISEREGVFSRQMRWSAIASVCAVEYGGDLTEKPWVINSLLARSSANPGGTEYAPLDPDSGETPARTFDQDNGDAGSVKMME